MASSQRSLRNMTLILLGIWLGAYVLKALKLGSVPGAAYMAAAVVATAIVTFFGVLRLGVPSDSRTAIPDGSLRSAIAASTVVTYLVLVGSASLSGQWVGDMPEVAKTLLYSFTGTTSIIVGFYFGSSAYVAARTAKARGADDRSPNSRDHK